jgi:hypothetical protein
MMLFALLFLGSSALAQPDLHQILDRVAEEAEVFEQNAPKAVTQETLEQRALLPPSRFRPRLGQAAVDAPKPRIQAREIISEYSVSPLRQSSSPDLYEFRQVVSVDGRSVQSAETARHALALGVQSADDRIRKRMLENFARNGLVDVATDYGLILLAFSKRGLQHMDVTFAGESRVGADDVLVLNWKQNSEAAGVLEFNGRQATRIPLQGTLWVRKSNFLPLRVQAMAEHPLGKSTVRDEATVDYTLSSHGFLTPVSVVHRHLVDGQLLTENLYRYQPFKLFSADAAISFDVPDSATTPPVKK